MYTMCTLLYRVIEQACSPLLFSPLTIFSVTNSTRFTRMSSDCFIKSILYHNTIIIILCFHMNYNNVSRIVLYRSRIELGAYLIHRFNSATKRSHSSDRCFVDGCSAQRRGKSDKAARPQLFYRTAIFYDRTRENRCSIVVVQNDYRP